MGARSSVLSDSAEARWRVPDVVRKLPGDRPTDDSDRFRRQRGWHPLDEASGEPGVRAESGKGMGITLHDKSVDPHATGRIFEVVLRVAHKTAICT